MTWHVANVTNLIISTESLTGANIEVRHAKNESSMIMDRCGTQTSVILHKFAKGRPDQHGIDVDADVCKTIVFAAGPEVRCPCEGRGTSPETEKKRKGFFRSISLFKENCFSFVRFTFLFC